MKEAKCSLRVSSESMLCKSLNVNERLAQNRRNMSVPLQTNWSWVQVPLQSLKFEILHIFRALKSLTFSQLQSEDPICIWDMVKTPSLCTIQIRNHNTTQLNHLPLLAKCLNIHLWDKWLWIQILLQSIKESKDSISLGKL